MNNRWFRIKAILINCGIAAALVYRYWTGTPMLIIVVVGIFLFGFANFLMLFAAKQQTNRHN
jgi:Flp pilus assembly protein TadB